MRVISRLNSRNQFLDPKDIDWMHLDIDNTPLSIRQAPGKINALGRIKFIFPNNYKVYLHDTPSRGLFARNTRALSHGCVRIEHPLELAKVLLESNSSWTLEKLQQHIKRNKTKLIKLDKPVPLHITYMTAWVDPQGAVHFRPDIYQRDRHVSSISYKTPY